MKQDYERNYVVTYLFKIAICICLLLVLAMTKGNAQENLPVERYAIYVASNDGGAEREKLRYAGSDAERLAKTMMEVGGISEENSIILIDPKKKEIDKNFSFISEKINKNKSKAKRTEFVFYYSGHSDENAILLGNEAYDYSNLKKSISDVPSDVHVVMLDSCFSGNFIRAKGGSRQKSFLVDDSTVVQGHAYLSSSSESESSQESDTIMASYFTQAMITGLRGAADASNDGKVSLNELYYYAFNETLSQTETSRIGPQHPSYNITLVGSGDLVLTDITSSESLIILPPEAEGKFYIRTIDGQLVSEINKIKGNKLALAVSKGYYLVTLITNTVTQQSTIEVKANQTYVLSEKEFAPIELSQGRARGNVDTVKEEPELTEDDIELLEDELDNLDDELNEDLEELDEEELSKLEKVKQEALEAVKKLEEKNKEQEKSESDKTNEILMNTNNYGFTKTLNKISQINDWSLFSIDCLFFKIPSYKANTFISFGIFSANANNIMGVQAAPFSVTTNGSLIGAQIAGFSTNVGNMIGGQVAGFSANADYVFGAQVAGFSANIKRFEGAQVAGFYTGAKNDSFGAQVAGFLTTADNNYKGAQVAGFMNIVDNNSIDFQVAGFMNIAGDNILGLQAAGFMNITDNNFSGTQAAGFMNLADNNFAGFQAAGFMNIADHNSVGFQAAGFMNIVDELKGTQAAGFINIADKIDGVQIGIINIADENNGLAIGLLNFIGNGVNEISFFQDTSATAYLQYQGGTNYLFNTFLIGVGETEDSLILGGGIGTRLRSNPNSAFSFDIEALVRANTYAAITTDTTDDLGIYIQATDDAYIELLPSQNILPSLRFTTNLHLGKHFGFFATADFGVHVHGWNDDAFTFGEWENNFDIVENVLSIYPSYSIGIRF